MMGARHIAQGQAADGGFYALQGGVVPPGKILGSGVQDDRVREFISQMAAHFGITFDQHQR